MASITMILGGCANTEDLNELQDYIKQIKQRPERPIEPLPLVKPYTNFIYEAQDLRSPFIPLIIKEKVKTVPTFNGIEPDVHRRKETLEHYPLDNLRMVGTLRRQEQIWAIILDNKGTIHRVQVGHHLGQHHGEIQVITQEQVLINEIVPDGQGRWQERKSSLMMVE